MVKGAQVFSRGSIEKVITELSGKMRLPLVFTDTEGNVYRGGDEPRGQGVSRPGGETLALRAPVYVNREMVGTLACNRAGEHGEALLNAAVVCLETSFRLESDIEDLSSEVVRVYEELSLIYSLSSKLGSELDINTICRQVVEEISRVLGVRTIALMLLDDGNGTLSIQYRRAEDREPAGDARIEASAEPFVRIFEKKSCAVIPDAASATGLPFTSPEALCVPLVTDNRNIGMLIAGDKASGKEFRSQEIKLLDALSGEIAAAIKKAQLYERINKLFMNTVEALASAIDAKDPYTYGHSRRVAQISEAICRELGLPGEEIRSIELAALLHDIGKIGTPEHILRKPGRLQPQEMEIVKEHPLQGAHILSTIDELQEVTAWIMHHHERYDGTGYPGRLKGKAIPLEARVITVADSFDAIVSARPYKKGLSVADALAELKRCEGSQFDPEVVESLGSFIRKTGKGKMAA